VIAPCAYLAAVITTLHTEPLLEENRDKVAILAEPAYQMLRLQLSVLDLSTVSEVAQVIPTSSEELAISTPPLSDDICPNSNQLAMRKIQGALVLECDKIERFKMDQMASHDLPYSEGRTVHDVNHTNLAMYRSQMSRMFVGSLYHFRNRLSIYGFVFHCRYFFNLPALVPECRDTGNR
jgi:hypothetical protein